MMIKEKLSRITCGIYFLSCLLFSAEGWSSAPSSDERREGGLLLRRAPLENEIPVLPKDAFENLRVRPGGTTLSSSLFREKATGQIWIGKSQGQTRAGTMDVDQEGNESLACREKIASDVYGLYGVSVPRTVLSRQRLTNTGIECLEGQDVIHILSCKIDDYHDYKKQLRFPGFSESLDPESGPVVCHDSRCSIEACRGEKRGRSVAYDVEGLGRAAAVATWVHDVDFIGGSASNVGYRITNREGQSVAELIMVDPGESFSDPAIHPYPPARHIRFAMPGSPATHTLPFERFFPEGSRARDEFFMTLHAIINTNEREIVRFFSRSGAEFFISRDPRSIPGLTRQLRERQRQLAADYAPELKASQLRYQEEEIERTRPLEGDIDERARPVPEASSPSRSGGAAHPTGPEAASSVRSVAPVPPPSESTGRLAAGEVAVSPPRGAVSIAPRAIASPPPPRLLGPAIPAEAIGHEEIYLRFVRGKLIYKPNKDSDVGRIDLPFAALPNPLEGTFDLRGCGDTGTRLSINSGYRKGKRAENGDKVEVWITPKFMVEQGLATTARHLAPIMGSFTSPVGVFWTWGGWGKGNMDWYDYLTTQNFDILSDGKNLYEKYGSYVRHACLFCLGRSSVVLQRPPTRLRAPLVCAGEWPMRALMYGVYRSCVICMRGT